MTKVRPAMGLGMTLDEALKREAEVEDWSALMRLLRERYDFWPATDENVSCEKYGQGIDERCGWDTHLVCISGKAVLFADGMIAKEKKA